MTGPALKAALRRIVPAMVLQPRERLLLLLALPLLAAGMLTIGVIWPIEAANNAASARLQGQDTLISTMRANFIALKAAADLVPAGASIPPATAVTQEAAAHGIAIQRLDREGNRLRVTLDSVRYTDLIAWLDALERDHGLRTAGADIERRPAPGMVSAHLSIED